MFSHIDRSALVPGGFIYEWRKSAGMEVPEIADDVAEYRSVQDGRFATKLVPVTFAQIRAERVAEQRKRLERIRYCRPEGWRPCYVWTFFVPGWLFSGWWCYIETRHGSVCGSNHKGGVASNSATATDLMREIPLGMFPVPENFKDWMEALSKVHPRRGTKKDPRKAGIFFGWTDGSHFRATKPRLDTVTLPVTESP